MYYSRNVTRRIDVVVGIDGIDKMRAVLLGLKRADDRAGAGDDGRGLGWQVGGYQHVLCK